MSFPMDSYCMQCYLRRNIDLVRPLGPETKTTAFAKEIMKLFLAAPEGVTAPWFTPHVSRLLHEKLGIEQNVGNGHFGLVGNVPDESFQLVLLCLHISGRYRGHRKVVGQLAFQCGEHGFIEAVLGEIPLHGDVQHPVQVVKNPPGASAIP